MIVVAIVEISLLSEISIGEISISVVETGFVQIPCLQTTHDVSSSGADGRSIVCRLYWVIHWQYQNRLCPIDDIKVDLV